MPLTPRVSLPMDLASTSLKNTAFPALETTIKSALPSVKRVPTSSSLSSSFIARLPFFLGFINSDKGVFLTIPFWVAMNT